MNARKMIKAVILGIAAAVALSVSGCSDGNKAPDQGAVQKESPLMQKIKKQGKLVVGTASGYPPYEFIDTSVGEKKVIGIDMALAQKIADELGVKLEVQDMNFQALLTSLTGGKVDIAIAGINPTEERKKLSFVRQMAADTKNWKTFSGKPSAYKNRQPRKLLPKKRLKMRRLFL